MKKIKWVARKKYTGHFDGRAIGQAVQIDPHGRERYVDLPAMFGEDRDFHSLTACIDWLKEMGAADWESQYKHVIWLRMVVQNHTWYDLVRRVPFRQSFYRRQPH